MYLYLLLLLLRTLLSFQEFVSFFALQQDMQPASDQVTRGPSCGCAEEEAQAFAPRLTPSHLPVFPLTLHRVIFPHIFLLEF